MGLLGGDVIAIDGSKFKAVNSSDRNFSEKKLQKKIKQIEETAGADEVEAGHSPCRTVGVGSGGAVITEKEEALQRYRKDSCRHCNCGREPPARNGNSHCAKSRHGYGVIGSSALAIGGVFQQCWKENVRREFGHSG